MTGLNRHFNDEQWATTEPFMPKNQPGARRGDDRRGISNIIHVLKTGCRWIDWPQEYAPYTMIYNRFNRWSWKRLWIRMLKALPPAGAVTKCASINGAYVKAQRSAFGGKWGRSRKVSGRRGAARPANSKSSLT